MIKKEEVDLGQPLFNLYPTIFHCTHDEQDNNNDTSKCYLSKIYVHTLITSS